MAGAPRGGNYSAADASGDSIEKMTAKLTVDLRARVRRLQIFPPLTPEWSDMVDTIHHLASVAISEERDSVKKTGSVWDREELCIRYIIEEGKINMLTRAMVEFKAFDATPPAAAATEAQKSSMSVYETSLGMLLKCAYSTIEALQTLDLPMLLEHISKCLDRSLAPSVSPEALADGTAQEVLVVAYLNSIAYHIENLNEDTVMRSLLDLKIISLTLRHWEKFEASLAHCSAGVCLFLAGIFDTETFQSKRNEFLTPEDKKILVRLEAPAKSLMGLDPSTRKRMRPLMDNILRFK